MSTEPLKRTRENNRLEELKAKREDLRDKLQKVQDEINAIYAEEKQEKDWNEVFRGTAPYEGRPAPPKMVENEYKQQQDWNRVYRGSKPYEGFPPPLELIQEYWKKAYASGYMGPN